VRSQRPDFFIAGARKCGTTALFEHLLRHPQVFMPAIKEPKFFCPELKVGGGVYDRDEYAALFSSAPAQLLTGEASTLCLYSRVPGVFRRRVRRVSICRSDGPTPGR
jgi:hypothetical protein